MSPTVIFLCEEYDWLVSVIWSDDLSRVSSTTHSVHMMNSELTRGTLVGEERFQVMIRSFLMKSFAQSDTEIQDSSLGLLRLKLIANDDLMK